MPNPVTPDQIAAIVPSPTSNICDRMVRVLLRFPNLISQFWEWAYDSAGEVTVEHRRAFFPVGTYFFSASSVPPVGCLECNGTDVSRSDYAELFALIGTTFGAGNGTTTFTLPSFNDKMLRGRGTTSAGATGGADSVTINLVEGQLAQHQHFCGVEAGPSIAHAVPDGKFRVGSGADLEFLTTPSTKAGVTENTGAGDDIDIDTVSRHLAVYCYIQA